MCLNKNAGGDLRKFFFIVCLVALTCELAIAQPADGNLQIQPANSGTPPSAEPKLSENPLALEQAQVAERFKKLESLLIKSAELESASNPTRAAILQQAAQLGKQSQLSELLARAAKSLQQKQFSQAIDDQKSSRDNLKRLLELLQSENRHDRIREQKEEVKRWIEETDRLLRLQISQRGRTEGGQDARQASKDQGKLADKANEIAEGMKGIEAKDSQPPRPDSAQDSPESTDPNQQEKSTLPQSDKLEPQDSSKPAADSKAQSPDGSSKEKGTEATPPEQKSADQDAQELNGKGKANAKGKGKEESSPKEKNRGDEDNDAKDKPSDSKPNDNQSQPADEKTDPNSQPNGSAQPQPNQPKSQQSPSNPGQPNPSEAEPSPSSPGEPKDSSPQEPEPRDPQQRAKQRLQSAQQKMKEAQRQLEDAKRKEAVEKQLEAEEQLRAAIEELEEILRQMREEEIERSLTALDTRLRRMLEMQSKVLDETKRLHEIAGAKADRQVEIRASNLSLDERKILAEGERAQLLLREEGSSVAFPEAITQVLDDVQMVVDRLSKADVGKMTIAIEQEIVSALEEMVAALAQVQKDQKERQQQNEQQPPQQPQAPPGEQPLVDKLAELRLIRTLQVRVNKRTNTLSELLKDPNDPIGQAEAEEILQQIRELAQRQSSVQRVTRDIVVGKAK